MGRTFEGARVDVSALAGSISEGSALAINTVRKVDLKRLKGLETLPLSTLSLRWLSASDLTQVPLPPSLTSLRIWHSSKLVSLEGISAAFALEEVLLRGNGPLLDAMALRELPRLHSLAIEGDPMSLQQIPNLNFLEGLSLRHLTLRGIDGARLDLGPVARLTRLESLDVHGPNFAPIELAKIAATRPWFLKQLMELPTCRIVDERCSVCGGGRKELFLRSTKGLWCPACEAAELDRNLNAFLRMVSAARSSGERRA